MVAKDNSIYLFIGQDRQSKEIKLQKLRQELFGSGIEPFNLDILYAKELSLTQLEERLLSLPIKVKKRLIVIKDADKLNAATQEFIIRYIKNPSDWIALVLDIEHQEPKDEFINYLLRYTQVSRFQEAIRPPNTFTLSRAIARRQPDYALRLLHQLLKEKEKPERILGGLRYVYERDAGRIKLLLNCDIEIKTGRLKPNFALEKLVVTLCGFGKSFG